MEKSSIGLSLFALLLGSCGVPPEEIKGLVFVVSHLLNEDSHLSLRLSPSEDSSGKILQLRGEERYENDAFFDSRWWMITHKDVRDYYISQFPSVENLQTGEVHGGFWNFTKKVDDVEQSFAFFCTFYLTNTSNDKSQAFNFGASLNSELPQDPKSRGPRTYDYLRAGVRLGDYGKKDDSLRIFGNENTKKYGTDYNGVKDKTDYRECLAKTGSYDDWKNPEETASGERVVNTYRYPTYTSSFNEEEVAFCELFQPGNDGLGLFSFDDTIAPGTSRRITFFAYLEGEDPDSYSDSPINHSLSFSLTISEQH